MQQRTVAKKLALEIWRQRVEAELGPLITAQIELAKGAFVMLGKVGESWVRVTDPDTMLQFVKNGEDFYRIEQKEPDCKMAINVMDRLCGRPKEQMEITGADGGPVRVRFVDA